MLNHKRSNQDQSSSLIIFVKYPTPGTVKTRLAKTSGDTKAAEFYQVCAEHIVRVTSRLSNARCIIACPPANDGSGVRDVQNWLGPLAAEGTRFVEQAEDEDLGERMFHALHEVVGAKANKAVLIGSDIPDICVSTLEAALAALDNHEVIFGPAVDGGYYLVGTSRLHPEMFQGISWSTCSALSESISRAASVGLKVAPRLSLPVLRDIDTIEDLQAWLVGLHDLEHPVRGISAQIIASTGRELTLLTVHRN